MLPAAGKPIVPPRSQPPHPLLRVLNPFQCTALFGAGAAGALFTPLGMIHPLIPMIGGFVPLFMLYSSSPQTHSIQYRYGTMGAFTFMSGMGAAPLMGAALATSPMNIPLAAGATSLIFVGFSAAALYSKQGSMLKMGGPLMGGTLGLGGLMLVGMFYPMPILYTIYPYAFVTLGSLWVAYDTQSIITRFQEGDSDHIQHAMDLFIDLKMIFMSVLRILGMND